MTSEAVPNVYDDPKSAEISRQHAEHRRNFGAITVALAAQESGASVQWLTPHSFLASFENRRVQITRYYGAESAVAWSIERDKVLAKKFWSAAGISVPPGRKVHSMEDAVLAQEEIGAAVVVKPVTALGGTGVTVNVTAPEDVRDGFLRAEKSGTGVLVEKYVHGNEYRAHATAAQCYGVFQRVLPNVTGDGHSSIEELIGQKNRMRQMSPATKGRPIPIDGVTEGFLRRRGLALDTVVAQGQQVVVRDVNSLTSGGDTRECLDTVSDGLKQTAVAAAAAIPGMNWAGVDIIIEESTGTPYVMEINTNAMTIGSIFPVFGTPRNLAKVVFQKVRDRCVPDVEGEPEMPVLHTEGIALGTVGSSPGRRRLSLQNLLKNRLEQRGYSIVGHNKTVWSAESADRRPLWFGGMRSESDLRIATIALTQLAVRQQLLKVYGVPEVPSRSVRSLKELEEFRADSPGPVTITRANRTRSVRSAVVIGADEQVDDSVLSGGRRWTARQWVEGKRFSIIASPERAFAVIGEMSSDLPDPELLIEAAKLAVSAVRALPQLNWAIVEVVCPSTPTHGASCLVEGFSSNLTFSPDDRLLAGSIDDALDWISDH